MISALLFLTLMGVAGSGVRAAPVPPEDVVVARIPYAGRDELVDLARRLDIWEVHPEVVVARVWPDQWATLTAEGYHLSVDPELSAVLVAPRPVVPGQTSGIPGYPCYRTVEETYAAAEAIVAQHPDLAAWIDVGDTWERTQDPDAGYDLYVLRLTNAATPGPKPKLFVMSSVHAREYTPAELSLRFAEHLIAQYDVDPDVTWMLDYHEIHLLLQANPDGRKHAEAGLYWRKNTNNAFCSDTDLRGVDLNRNFEFRWGCCGGSSGMVCDLTYRGPDPASEPEVQSVQDYLRATFPDLRDPGLSAAAPVTTSGIFFDVHSYSELVLWPWGFQETPAPNATALATLGRRLATFNGYTAKSASGLYPVDGDTIDFAYGELGLASYVFELGTSFFQPCDSFEATIYPDNLQALLYAAKVVRQPYRIPAGPDVTALALTPPGVVQGQPVSVTATVVDGGGGAPGGVSVGPTAGGVAEAAFYLDVPPWEAPGAGVVTGTLAAKDGAFDASTEEVVGTLDTAALSPGRHILFVQGRGEGGVWGPPSAVFLYVTASTEAAFLEGYVRDGATHAPLAAHLTAGLYHAQTDPATGYYRLSTEAGAYDLHVAGPAGYVTTTLPGVQTHARQTARQDVHLYSPCPVFSDTVESGAGEWTAEGAWAITDADAHSGAHAWTDSPGGPYATRGATSLTSPSFDLAGYGGVGLRFWHRYALYPDDDIARVEVSTDGGATWTSVAAFQGAGEGWTPVVLRLPELDGQRAVRVRFRLISGPFDTDDGWYVDDVALTVAGPACVTPFAPTAAFTHTRALAGYPMRFTNLTYGAPPLDAHWDFGDGVGASSAGDPRYTYARAGTFTVTLAVTNAAGSDVVARPVTVAPPRYLYLPLTLRY
jgi:murein tripeptide amidase MpaA